MSEDITEIIEFDSREEKKLIHCYPPDGSEVIGMGSQLVVRKGQKAIFYRQEKVADVFGPGTYILTPHTLPIISALLRLPEDFQSLFRANVAFVSEEVYSNWSWKTEISLKHPQFPLGLIKVRSEGEFSFQVTQAEKFLNALILQGEVFSEEEIQAFLEDVISISVNEFLMRVFPKLELASFGVADLDSAIISRRIEENFKKKGVKLVDFSVKKVFLPPQVRQKLAEIREKEEEVVRSESVVAESSPSPAEEKPIPKVVKKEEKVKEEKIKKEVPSKEPEEKAEEVEKLVNKITLKKEREKERKEVMLGEGIELTRCWKCHTEVPAEATFCLECGSRLEKKHRLTCRQCGTRLLKESRFCHMCGEKVSLFCAQCGTDLPLKAKFCFKCGAPV